MILPALMQEVHTLTRLGVPPTMARTRWMLGSKRRRVAFFDISAPVMTTRRRLKGYREAVAGPPGEARRRRAAARPGRRPP